MFVDGGVEEEFCLGEEGIAERGGHGEEEEDVDGVWDGEGGDDGFGGSGLETEGCGEGVEFFVVLDVFVDAVVVATCAALASHHHIQTTRSRDLPAITNRTPFLFSSPSP